MHVRTFDKHFKEPDLIAQSLAPELNILGMHNAGEYARKTGRFVFYSHDNKYLIKSITPRQFKIYREVFGGLANHYLRYPQSLIARIFGVFTVEM